ncbi:PhnD/SsuA/transferrin family substrate-binding protein [uncultured Rhodoferax sp.]|uniref:phosphate/phosphite/phosphonate ABC transporter substrate-binding protein n=1 Tax=uncultured Rhodoferax sp. TaxID=223188 RepID=UPI0025FE8DCB|nr:PhnD/SsuA/transferrin family substrate-binding protein [uncultured Rhodoferax sp.]
MTVGLPMYYPREGALQAFWDALRTELPGHSLPATLEWPDDYMAHWRAPTLLLSQTCGYPLVRGLRGSVQLLGSFVYDVPGAQGMDSRSQLICRRGDARSTLAAFRSSTVAFNAPDSQSGYNALRARIAPLAQEGRFFGRAIETGAHLQSIAAVLDGRADLAAIDAVTWALALEARPALAQALTVLDQTAPYPGLPLITALQTPAETVAQLQAALHTVATAARHAAVRAPLRITGFVRSTLEDYAVCETMEAQAWALGVYRL